MQTLDQWQLRREPLTPDAIVATIERGLEDLAVQQRRGIKGKGVLSTRFSCCRIVHSACPLAHRRERHASGRLSSLVPLAHGTARLSDLI
jgi:hypothetical protein